MSARRFGISSGTRSAAARASPDAASEIARPGTPNGARAALRAARSAASSARRRCNSDSQPAACAMFSRSSPLRAMSSRARVARAAASTSPASSATLASAASTNTSRRGARISVSVISRARSINARASSNRPSIADNTARCTSRPGGSVPTSRASCSICSIASRTGTEPFTSTSPTIHREASRSRMWPARSARASESRNAASASIIRPSRIRTHPSRNAARALPASSALKNSAPAWASSSISDSGTGSGPTMNWMRACSSRAACAANSSSASMMSRNIDCAWPNRPSTRCTSASASDSAMRRSPGIHVPMPAGVVGRSSEES